MITATTACNPRKPRESPDVSPEKAARHAGPRTAQTLDITGWAVPAVREPGDLYPDIVFVLISGAGGGIPPVPQCCQVNDGMARPQERLGFVGIRTYSPMAEAESWMNSLVRADLRRPGENSVSPRTLQDVVQHLQAEYGIAGRDVLYVEGDSGEAQYQVPAPGVEQQADTTTTGYQALVNPAWEGENADRPQNTPVWHIATDDYTPVSPGAKYGPLLGTIRDYGDATDSVFGEVRRYRNGGEIHADLWFPRIDVDLGGDRHIIGFTTGYDYYGGIALYAQVIAGNTETGTVMRGLADRFTRRHRGAAGDQVAGWWATMLERAENATDALAQTVAEAQEYEVDFTTLPITSRQYLLGQFGGTEYLAEVADDYLAGGDTPDTASAWALYDAMAAAITHEFEGKDNSAALRRYLRAANEQLFSPPAAERGGMLFLEQYEGLDGQQDLEGNAIQSQLREHRLSLDDAVQRYEERKTVLKRMLDEIEAEE